MRVFLILLLLMGAAHAASVTTSPGTVVMVYTNQAGTIIGQKSYTVTDADMAKVETAYGATLIANGNPTPTVAQELVAMTNSWVQLTINFVQNYNVNQATLSATSGVTPPSIQ